MNIETEIYLKCSSCDKSHEYIYSDSEYNAIEVEWISPNKNFHLLEIEPNSGNKYQINLIPTLTLNTVNPFWAVYLNPNSTLNGIETEIDLKDIRFCKCQTEKIIESNHEIALLEIKVLEVKKIDDLLTDKTPNIQWKNLMINEDSFSRYGTTENFKYYSFIDVNIESDLGISAIVKKENNVSHIVAINQWDFHLNEWILCRISLNEDEEKKYGIQHVV